MQSQEERIPHLLERVELSRFQLKDYRNFDDCEYRTPGLSSKPSGKTFEVIYNHTFNHDLLVTHLEIEFTHREAFQQLFEVGEIEASNLTNRGMLAPVIRSSPLKKSYESKNMIISCVSITQSLRISLLLKKEFLSLHNDSLNFKKEKSRHASEENVTKMINHALKAINICGYQLSMNTAASELVNLLNISQAFKYSNRFDQAAETDILVSLSLISARRFVQAAECLRKVSSFYLEKYISSKSSMDFTRIDKSWIKEENREQLDITGFSRSFATGRVLEGGRYLYRAAKIELLRADTINQPSLLGEKLDAYSRANSFANGNISPSKIQARIDYEEVIYNMGPTIIPFLVKVLTDKSQMFKISALKSIEFFYETLGCTLGNFMPLIMKTLIVIYPSQKEDSGLKTQQNWLQRSQSSTRTKLILDHTNHLLESLLSIIQGMSKKWLKMMFEEIILVSLSDEYRNELRLYLLRFAERILQICGADLDINVTYIRYLLAISEGKYTIKSDLSKHINHNLIYFAQRVLDLLKTKILKHYNRVNSLSPITTWMHDTLIGLCEQQTIVSNTHLNNILDLVVAIYSNPRVSLPYPIEPVIYLLNTSLNEPKLPFDKILDAFIVLVKHGSRYECGVDLGSEIIERVLGRSRMTTLSLKELKILQRVVEIVKEVKTVWLQQFLECIPHSNFDEIYVIFDLLVLRCIRYLNKQLITVILHTLFNQYTVKGKAHQHSKEQFITTIIKELPGSLDLLLQICLFQNEEPKIDNYFSKKTIKKEHGFDSKLYKLHSELFGEKINLLLLISSKSQLIVDKFKAIFNRVTLFKFYLSSKQILEQSNNFKIKSKFLILIKQLILLAGLIPDEGEQQMITSKIFLAKVVLEMLRPFMNIYKESKLQYYSLLNIGLLFQQLVSKGDKGISQASLDFMDGEVSVDFQVPFPLEVSMSSIIGHEVLKLWVGLLALLNSPLENVREMVMLLVLHTFRNGLTNFKATIRDKLTDLLKPLLGNCLQSNDHSERLTGIKLLALLLGFGKEYSNIAAMNGQIEENLKPLRQLFELVIVLEDDWNQEILSCSKLISKICLSKELKMGIVKRMKSGKRMNFFQTSNLSFNLEEEIVFDKKQHSFDILNSFDAILKADDDFNAEESFEIPGFRAQFAGEMEEFRLQIAKINFNSVDNMPERDSFVQEEQQYFDPNDQKHSDKEKELSNPSEEEQLEFQDLGIIELDDEEWGEEESEVRITQKLPLKKVYKLSPNLASSTKHHRLRNKLLHHSEFEQDKIIVDEVDGRINSSPPQQLQPKIQEMKQDHSYEQYEVNNKVEVEQPVERPSLTDDFTVSQTRPSKKEKEKKNSKKRKTSAAK